MLVKIVGVPKRRVSPGSVAANGLTPGDVILKIGNVNATSLSHTDAQDVIRGASNILQFTIKKGSTVSAPVSPTYTPPQYAGGQSSGYGSYDQNDPSANYPDYRVGSGYSDLGYNNSSSSGYNTLQGSSSPYNAGPQYSQSPAVSGYSTLPARGTSRQNSESFRSVQQQPQLQQAPPPPPQNKYPYKTTAGIQLNVNPQVQSSPQSPYSESQSQPMSPVQYQNDFQSESPYQRQSSVGSNNSYPASYYKKPTPFSPGIANQNGSTTPPPRLQRQKSQGSTHEATVTQGFQPGTYLPKSDDAPPPPPPPVNYRQPEPYGRSPYDQEPSPSPYQRQTSQPQQGTPYQRQGSYGQQSPYDSYNQQQPQSGMYVDTTPTSAQQLQRQGSQHSDYNSGPKSYPQSPASYQRQPSYGSQSYQPAPPPPPPQQYDSPYAPTTPTQSYSRQQSRDQIQSPSYSKPTSPPSSGTGINSFDDILSPFEKFQNSNYCDKLFSRDNRDVDSGVMSDLSEPGYQSQSLSSDTPRSNQSSFSSYSPPQPAAYPGGYGNTAPQSQNLLRPAPQAPPPPPVTPPPPPPPPPPSNWTPSPRRTPANENGQSGGPQQQQMPDKVLNTMLKNAGTQKPFSYVPTGLDLQKFKDKARQRNQPRSVMPRGYVGPDLDAEELQGRSESPKPKGPGAAPNPDSGVYRHAQYNSPLRMYSSDNARDALSAQSGGGFDVSGLNSTPERRPSDIKESEVYRMCQEADAKGYKPKKPRNPLLRHNSEDDEMRFTGLHSKADIPSKIFQRLNKLTVSSDTPDAPAGQTPGKQADDDEPERVGNYDEASIRYRGNYIPSPSFRLLQSLAKEDKQQTPSPGRTDDEDDGLPDQLPDDMVDKRYTGTPAKPSDGGGPKIKVISKSKPMSPKTVPKGTESPKPVEHPSTDF